MIRVLSNAEVREIEGDYRFNSDGDAHCIQLLIATIDAMRPVVEAARERQRLDTLTDREIGDDAASIVARAEDRLRTALAAYDAKMENRDDG